MNFKIFAINLAVPVLTVLAISAVAGYFKRNKKESVKSELFDYFVKVWNAEDKETGSEEEKNFFQNFYKLFVQSYEYEKYKESTNKNKYYFYKVLVLIVILSIPFLMLVLFDGKDWILTENGWDNIYLYTLILVPLMFAFMVNKYIKIRHYHGIWYRHLRNRHYMEWRMMVFVKDFEMIRAGLKADSPDQSVKSLKIDFINDISEYWKKASEIVESEESKEEGIFQDLSNLFSKS